VTGAGRARARLDAAREAGGLPPASDDEALASAMEKINVAFAALR